MKQTRKLFLKNKTYSIYFIPYAASETGLSVTFRDYCTDGQEIYAKLRPQDLLEASIKQAEYCLEGALTHVSEANQ